MGSLSTPEGSTLLLKGRIAEAVIECLFLEAGYKVSRFGQEWRAACSMCYPTLCSEIFKYKYLPDHQQKRPDFAIKTPKGEIQTVEVKFRTDETSLYHMVRNKDYIQRLMESYPGTNIVIILPFADAVIQVLPPPYIENGDPVMIPLWCFSDWGISLEVARKYEAILRGIPFHLFP